MYGYGLLGFRDSSFYQLEISEFLAMVDGAMQWELEKEDRLFEQQSIFIAHQLFATGNMKKSTNFEKLIKQLYLPMADRLAGVTDSKVQHVGREKVAEERQKLRDKFLTE